jgi:Tol biopolymer transport system component
MRKILGLLSLSFLVNITFINFAMATNEDILTALSTTMISETEITSSGNAAYITIKAIEKKGYKQYQYAILFHNAAGTESQIISSENRLSNLQFSANDNWLSYVEQKKDHQILVAYNILNNEKIEVAKSKGSFGSHHWAKADKAMLYTMATDAKPKAKTPIDIESERSRFRLYMVGLKSSGKAIELTHGDESIEDFAVSKDSKTLAFIYQDYSGPNFENGSKLALYNLEARKIIDYDYVPGYSSQNPKFSPDNKWLAFDANIDYSDNPYDASSSILIKRQVCAIELESHAFKCLPSTDNENMTTLAWANDSKGLYTYVPFNSHKGAQVYYLNLHEQSDIELVSDFAGNIGPMFAPLPKINNEVMIFRLAQTNVAPEVYTYGLKSKSLMAALSKQCLASQRTIQQQKDILLCS